MFNKSLRNLSKSTTIRSPSPDDALWNQAANEAIRLAEYIPNEKKECVVKALLTSVLEGGNGLQDLVPFIAKTMQVEVNEVRSFALDLTRKVYCNHKRLKMLELGIEKFEWLHTGGGNNPFDEHVAMSGKIYRLDSPPIINSATGQRGFPSDLDGCRCQMLPVIEFDD